MKKRCSRCKEEKGLSEFNYSDVGKYQRTPECKLCASKAYAKKQGLVHFAKLDRVVCNPGNETWKRTKKPDQVTCAKCQRRAIA